MVSGSGVRQPRTPRVALEQFAALSMAVLAMNNDCIITDWNQTAQARYGWRPLDVIGRHCSEFLSGGNDVNLKSLLVDLASIHGLWNGRLLITRSNHEVTSVGCLTFPLADEEGVPGGFAWLLYEDDGLLNDALRELADLRQLARQIDDVRSQTLRELAGRLHDDLSQRCHQLLATTEHVLAAGVPDALRDRLESLREEQIELIDSLQRVWKTLRPPLLDEFGGRAALEQLALDAIREGGLDVSFDIDDEVDQLPAPVQEVVYLIAQEALSNVLSHARARRCSLTVTLESQSVVVAVSDDGIGFSGREGFGLRLMRERVASFGGFLEISPGPAGGTSVTAEIEQKWSKMAPLETLIDPHVVLKAVTDGDGQVFDFIYVDANDAALSYNHVSRAELIGQRLLDLLPGHRGSELFASYVRAFETGEPLVIDNYVYPNEIVESDRRYDIRAVRVGDSLSYTWRDVTERYDLIERYRLLVENASDIVYRVNTVGVIEWISPSVEPVLGWRPQELIGASLSTLHHIDDISQRPAHLAMSDDPAGTRFAVKFRHRDGSFHHFLTTLRTVHDDAGTVIARVGSARLADDEFLAREALEESERRFRLLAENASDVVILTDADGIITWVSPSITQFAGWSEEDFLGRTAKDFIPDDDLGRVEAARRQAGTSPALTRHRFWTKDRRQLWVQARGHTVLDEAGRPLNRVVTLSDVTAEVESAQTLRASQMGYRSLAESTPDIVYEYNVDGEIVWISSSVRRILGYDPQALRGTQSRALIHEEDLPLAIKSRERLLRGAPQEELTLRYRSAAGALVRTSVRVQPIRDATGAVSGILVGLHVVDHVERPTGGEG